MKEVADYPALTLPAACLIPGVVWAASSDNPDKLQAIIVSASKTGETEPYRIPIAISAFADEQLRQARITDASGLMGSRKQANTPIDRPVGFV
jgi:hypothetical protein